MENYVIWMALAIILFLAELLTLGVFLLFFALGAFTTAVAVYFVPLTTNLQIVLFLLVSVVSLLFLRAKIQSILYRKKKTVPSENVADVVGRQGEVVEAILPPAQGKVSLHGTFWAASSQQKLNIGDIITVIGRDNLTLVVAKLEG